MGFTASLNKTLVQNGVTVRSGLSEYNLCILANLGINPIFMHKKSPDSVSYQGSLNLSLTTTYSHMGSPTLPSAMALFTSEFGMGSGGSTPL